MYFYIYDSFLVEKKYAKLISRIESRLANLDIAGKKHQLTILRSVEEIVGEILKRETPTISIIGSDQIFCRAVLRTVGTGAVMGFVPTETDSAMAVLLGLPTNEYACDVISARRIESVGFGRINNQAFFSSLEFEADKAVLIADDKYQIIPRRVKAIKVINLDLIKFQQTPESPEWSELKSNPKDGYMEVLLGNPGKNFWFLKKREKLDSLFLVKKLKVVCKKSDQEITIRVDKYKTIKTPAIIEIAEEKIKIIVGKDRLI